LRAKAEIARKNPAFGRTRPSLREDLVQYDSRFSEEKQESILCLACCKETAKKLLQRKIKVFITMTK